MSTAPTLVREAESPERKPRAVALEADLAVIGGGVAGTCCAITAARQGLKVVLIQDRPVLGGNASSEVRLWLLGATVHMGSNNRWAREGGLVNEILMENLWRNPEGNPVIFDTVLLEKAHDEPNLTLLLNTACFEAAKAGPDRIASVTAYCAQNETLYTVSAPLFCDASGDGVLGFLAGAAFRMGAESREEFGEMFAPTGEFGFLLGHSIYFYSKDTGRPVRFVPPSFALSDIEKAIPRYRSFNTKEHGSQLWWIEWGGRLDTIHDTETIKWELWKVVYGVWNYIKNSGKFPDAENLTLEWIGHIPGKRESRRFEGDYILRQQDVIERRTHPDAVAFGGWSIDLHPADGVFAEVAGSHHLHSKGVYQIPYRCYYSRNIENLFLAGRIISASHVAFGTTRVMATCGLGGQAVAHAAALCIRHGENPRDVNKPERMRALQARLGADGHHIPAVSIPDSRDIAPAAVITASSRFVLQELPSGGPLVPLNRPVAQMLPLPAGPCPEFTVLAAASADAELEVRLLGSSDRWHHSPDVEIARTKVCVKQGAATALRIRFDAALEEPRYVFLAFPQRDGVSLHTSELRVTGLLRLHFSKHESDKTDGRESVGGEEFEVFVPERRPGGHNIALSVNPPLDVFQPAKLLNGWQRPTCSANAWIAAPGDPAPELRIAWDARRTLGEVTIFFDGDFDHSMETVLMGHPERAVVFCVKRYEVLDDQDRIIASADDNHQSTARHVFAPEPVVTSSLRIRLLETWGAPAAVFEVRCLARDSVETPAGR